MDCRSRVSMLLGIMVLLYLPRDSKGCEGNAIRLVRSGDRTRNKFEGRVEVCQRGQWKTVCNNGWDDKEAKVVCRQLGFAEDLRVDRVIWATRFFGDADPRQAIIKKTWRCSGSERELLRCLRDNAGRNDCGHDKDAGVFCYGRKYDNCQENDIRLAGEGADGLSGRVEVCLDRFWGTVCDGGWDMRDATTVCRQLGLSDIRGMPTRRAFFGEGIGPVHLSRARCTSEDTDLLNCTIDKSAVNGCDHSEDAGVVCSGPHNCSNGDVRLMGGESELEGRVEICYNGVWGTVCDNGWDERDATVVCKQLGFGQPGTPVSQIFGAGVGPILLNNVVCDRNHSELLQCVHPQGFGLHDCDRRNIAGVICPNVSAIATATTNIHLLATNTQATCSYTGVIYPSVSPSTTTNISPNITSSEITPKNSSTSFIMNSSLVNMISTSSLQLDMFATNTQETHTSESEGSRTVQSSAIFGAVGGVLGTVVSVAVVLIVVVTAVMIVTKKRKPNHQDAIEQEPFDNPIYDGSTSPGVANLDSSSQEASDINEKEFDNPLYSETGPLSCYQSSASGQPATESEYVGLYSDCAMNGEALYENTQNSVARGTRTNADGNTLHVTASGHTYGNNNVPPTLDGIEEDIATILLLDQQSLFNQGF